jgi:uncharacterized membrane protein YbhN (UPF0104 family)
MIKASDRKIQRLAAKLLRFAIGIFLLLALVSYVGIDNFLVSFSTYKSETISLVLLLQLTTFILGGIEISVLGRALNPKLPFYKAIAGHLATISLSLFTPGRLGDLSLPFYWRHILEPHQTLAIIFINKLTTLALVGVLGCLGACLLLGIRASLLTLAALPMAVLGALSLGLILRYGQGLTKLLPRFMKQTTQASLNSTKIIISQKPGFVALSACITATRIALYGTTYGLLLKNFGSTISSIYPICILSIAQLTSLLPISIMGLGTVEAVNIYCFGKLGIGGDTILACNAVGRMITLFWLGTFFVLFATKLKHRTQALDHIHNPPPPHPPTAL